MVTLWEVAVGALALVGCSVAFLAALWPRRDRTVIDLHEARRQPRFDRTRRTIAGRKRAFRGGKI